MSSQPISFIWQFNLELSLLILLVLLLRWALKKIRQGIQLLLALVSITFGPYCRRSHDHGYAENSTDHNFRAVQ